jgi:hypothetical protein
VPKSFRASIEPAIAPPVGTAVIDGGMFATIQCTKGRPSAVVASRSVTTMAKDAVSTGTPDQTSGGETSEPAHV